jgi:hypothetical protein
VTGQGMPEILRALLGHIREARTLGEQSKELEALRS